MQKPLKIGHRGAKGHVAENTIASIKKAIELGVDGVEIDVHKCASGELVVFHDTTLDRMTNGSGDISKFTLSQLQDLKIDNQYVIPTLTEVIDVIDKQCMLNIELKGENTAMESCKIVESSINFKGWNVDDFLISSFNFNELKTVYNHNSNLKLGVLTEHAIGDIVDFAKSIKAYSLNIHYKMIAKKDVLLAHNTGFKVYVWTVNNFKDIAQMKSYNVDAIISDLPDRL